jgi:hypothetical protein
VVAVVAMLTAPAVLAVLAVLAGRSVLGVLVMSPRRRLLAVGGSVLWVSLSVDSVVHGVLEGPIVDVHER